MDGVSDGVTSTIGDAWRPARPGETPIGERGSAGAAIGSRTGDGAREAEPGWPGGDLPPAGTGSGTDAGDEGPRTAATDRQADPAGESGGRVRSSEGAVADRGVPAPAVRRPPLQRPTVAPPALVRLEYLIRSRHPLIGLETAEEARAVEWLVAWSDYRRGTYSNVHRWSLTEGLVTLTGTPIGQQGGREAPAAAGSAASGSAPEDLTSLEAALAHIARATQARDADTPELTVGRARYNLFVLVDAHPFLKQPMIVRRLRDLVREFRGTRNTLVLVSPTLPVPEELTKDLVLAAFPLPTPYELGLLIEDAYAKFRSNPQDFDDTFDASPTLRDALVRALSGMTMVEADQALHYALLEAGGFTEAMVPSVVRMKREAVRRTDCLEIVEDVPMEDLGGLDRFKAYIGERLDALSDEARADGIEPPRGVVAVGVPGSGKSFGAKAVAGIWRQPLVRLNIGGVFSKWLSESEARLRAALRVAEAIAPLVLLVDEVGNAFAGVGGSGGSDGASQTTERVFGELLTWLNDREAPVFAYFTANEIQHLPAQLTRKGRIDQMFFFDFPTARERADILRIQLRRVRQDPEGLGIDLDTLAEAAVGFVGSELKGIVQDALIAARQEALQDADAAGRPRHGVRARLATRHLAAAIANTVPKARAEGEKIQRMRRLLEEGRVVPASSEPPIELDERFFFPTR